MELKDNIKKGLGSFWIFWAGQSVSQLGSAMTSFAMIIWAFEKTGSAFALSLTSIAVMVPKMIFNVLSGPFVDRADKKVLIIASDIGAGICTLILYFLLRAGDLAMWHIYCLNMVLGILASFQAPAGNVAVSLIVPKGQYVRANGLQSLSNGIIQITAPAFATLLLGASGITSVIFFDFATMLFACVTLAVFVKIPKITAKPSEKLNLHSYFAEMRQGALAIKKADLIFRLTIYMSFINFFAGLTYYNLLSPMVLAKTGGSSEALAFVNGALGAGSVAGALVVSALPSPKRRMKKMFLCLALSFILGDFLFASGRNPLIWGAGAFLSSVFLPYFLAHQSYFYRTIIPVELQGRVFSLEDALQFGTTLTGMLLGGLLADYVFEPFMMSPPRILSVISGSGSGAGMALMFLFTAVSGFTLSMTGLFSSKMAEEEEKAEAEANLRR